MTMAGGSCAQDQNKKKNQNQRLDAATWTALHFGGADLGDQRRNARVLQVAVAITEHPGMSLPKQFPAWSDLLGTYRLLSNPQVDPQAILAPHVAWTRQAAGAHRVVLCVQDTTQLDFTLRTGVRGLGIIGDGQGRGLMQHTALAVLPTKELLGILDLRWYVQHPVPADEKRRQQQARWSKEDVWQDAAVKVGRWPTGTQIIQVGDRHADVFRFLQAATVLGHGYVVRAMHDRYVDDATEQLWGKLERQVPLGQMRVTLGVQRDKGNRIKRAGREALLTIRVAPLRMPPPRNDPRTQEAAPLTLWAVYLLEEHPPAGVERVEWMLLSSLEAQTLEQAQQIIGYYTCRWVIEEWHRCYKEGCRIEDNQLDQAADIQRLGAVLAVVAVRLLQMRDLADGTGPAAESPAALRQLVPALYIMIVAGLAKLPPQTLTPRQFWRTIAKRGGYLGRKHDPRPGWKVLWRGWADIFQMVRGAELYQTLLRESKNCV